jgi:transcriptional/translational regulatory protein YebC/TACO1
MSVTINGSGQLVTQVVSATKTDKFTTTSSSYVTITGLSVAITPSSTSSKVLVSFNLNGGNIGASGAIRIYRGETAIAIGDPIQEPANNRMTANVYNGGDDANSTPNFSMSILDTPNTTSSTTYTLRAACVQSAGTIVINDQTSQIRNVNYSAVTVSTITVMEISG